MSRSISQRPCLPAHFFRAQGILVVVLMLAGILLTSACGFKLRGDVEIPDTLNPMFVQAKGGSAVRGAILERLQGSQVRLATEPQDARVIIRISSESRSTRVAALDRNGKALAYELHLHVTFDAVAHDGKQLAPRQSLDLLRTYDNADVLVLGKELEASLIYKDLVRDAANRILGRMRVLLL